LIQSGNTCKQCSENIALKLKVSQQENRLKAMEKTLGHFAKKLIEGKLPADIFTDQEKQKLLVE
jgi:hypothetical protein